MTPNNAESINSKLMLFAGLVSSELLGGTPDYVKQLYSRMLFALSAQLSYCHTAFTPWYPLVPLGFVTWLPSVGLRSRLAVGIGGGPRAAMEVLGHLTRLAVLSGGTDIILATDGIKYKHGDVSTYISVVDPTADPTVLNGYDYAICLDTPIGPSSILDQTSSNLSGLTTAINAVSWVPLTQPRQALLKAMNFVTV